MHHRGLRRKPDESRLDLINRNVSLFNGILQSLKGAGLKRDAIVFVVSNPVDILTQLAVEQLGLPVSRVIGLGTPLDTSRFCSLIAGTLKLAPSQVRALILGEHGDTMTPIWSSATVDGLPLLKFPGVTPTFQNQLFERTQKSGAEVISRKGGAGWAVGVAIREVIDCIALDGRRILPISSHIKGTYGISGISISVPTVVGRGGVIQHVEMELWPKEFKALQASAKALKDTRAKISNPMNEHHYIACDLGADSSRVIVGHLKDGRIALEEIHRFSSGMSRIHGSLRWDILRVFEEIKMGLRKIAENKMPVESLSVDSWGVDYVLFNKHQPMLSIPYHYRDARTLASYKAVREKLGDEKIFAETGIQFMPFNTLYQMRAEMEENSGTVALADQFLNIADYLNYLFSGVPRAEQSLASTTQIYNPMTRQWSRELINALHLPERIFPQIVPAGARLGSHPGIDPGGDRHPGDPRMRHVLARYRCSRRFCPRAG